MQLGTTHNASLGSSPSMDFCYAGTNILLDRIRATHRGCDNRTGPAGGEFQSSFEPENRIVPIEPPRSPDLVQFRLCRAVQLETTRGPNPRPSPSADFCYVGANIFLDRIRATHRCCDNRTGPAGGEIQSPIELENRIAPADPPLSTNPVQFGLGGAVQ